MCAIYGMFGPVLQPRVMDRIAEAARDRGRDGGGYEVYTLRDGMIAALGQWRATPTTEVMRGARPPFDGVVHNGTVANDAELGAMPGEIDSQVIPRVIDRSSAWALARSLTRIRGSYALAVTSASRVFLAANYKPLHYLAHEGAIYFASMERHLAPITPFGCRPAALEPYTVLDLLTHEVAHLPREASNRALVVCSAGLDSTTVAYLMRDEGWDVTLVHFTYGCRAEGREVERVRRIGQHLGAEVVVLPLDYTLFRGGSPLLTERDIAGGIAGAEYASEWVPARNLVMLSHAVAYAEANGYSAVALGNNLEESGAFPDNEEQFTHLLDGVLDYAVHDGGLVRLVSPVGHLMKHEIVRRGHALGVPYDLTWSCYRGGERHCGECGPCFMRREAFARNNLIDPAFSAEAV